jgi:hypothetical protein
MNKYFGGPPIDKDDYYAILRLDELRNSLLLEKSPHRRLAEIILWNAGYHLAPGGGRIPAFHKGWCITRDINEALRLENK